jgi:hypothetical protein
VGDLEYLHERIDQLVRQAALEVGLIRLHTGIDPASTRGEQDLSLELARNRFWAADDAAADNHKKTKRER